MKSVIAELDMENELLRERIGRMQEELAAALEEFRQRYNDHWLVERLRFPSPRQARREAACPQGCCMTIIRKLSSEIVLRDPRRKGSAKRRTRVRRYVRAESCPGQQRGCCSHERGATRARKRNGFGVYGDEPARRCQGNELSASWSRPGHGCFEKPTADTVASTGPGALDLSLYVIEATALNW